MRLFDYKKSKKNPHCTLLIRRSSIYTPFSLADVTRNFNVAGKKYVFRLFDKSFWLLKLIFTYEKCLPRGHFTVLSKSPMSKNQNPLN